MFEFLVEGVGVVGPVVGGGFGGVEVEVGIGLEGFGDHQDGEPLVVLVELLTVGRVVVVAEGEGLVAGVADGFAAGVACDLCGRLRGRNVVLVEAAVEAEGEGLDEEVEGCAVREGEGCRVRAGEVEGGVLVVHGEGWWEGVCRGGKRCEGVRRGGRETEGGKAEGIANPQASLGILLERADAD